MEHDEAARQNLIAGKLSGPAYSQEAIEEALPVVYGELKRLAAHFLRGERRDNSLVTTELVHEAYMRIFTGEEVSFTDRKHFFSTAAMSMRRILVDRARRRSASKRIPREMISPIDAAFDAAEEPDLEVLALDRALDQLGRIDPRQAQIVELRYFGGLTENEVCKILDLSRATVSRQMVAAKLWLKRQMRAT
ncbi:MAG: ECF-type sigma factor [Acidobacteriota bacterium]